MFRDAARVNKVGPIMAVVVGERFPFYVLLSPELAGLVWILQRLHLVRDRQAHAKSARAWEEALAAGNPGVSRGLWLKTARDFRRVLRLGCCKVSPPRKTKAMKAKKGGEKEAKAKKVMKAMK